jgi:hypothetical protein
MLSFWRESSEVEGINKIMHLVLNADFWLHVFNQEDVFLIVDLLNTLLCHLENIKDC